MVWIIDMACRPKATASAAKKVIPQSENVECAPSAILRTSAKILSEKLLGNGFILVTTSQPKSFFVSIVQLWIECFSIRL